MFVNLLLKAELTIALAQNGTATNYQDLPLYSPPGTNSTETGGILRSLALGLLTAVMLAHVSIAETPHRKPGLWEIKTAASGTQSATQSQLCMDATTEALFTRYTQGNGLDCAKRDEQRNANQSVIESQCTLNGYAVSTRAILTWSDDTAYHMVGHSQWNPPIMGRATSDTVQDGKWLGPCPIGVKPGDLTLPDGRTVNIASVTQRRQRSLP